MTEIFSFNLTPSGMASRGLASPYLSFFALCAFICLVTRLRTGFVKKRLENEVDSPTKDIPILPYWIPYLGHAPEFGWSFDDLLAKGRNSTKDGLFGLYLMGSQHYMVLMPSLTKQFFLQRPSVLSNDDFLHWIHEKYFGDGGASKRVGEDNFHTVHRSLNSLMKEPFLSVATAKTIELVQARTPEMISFSPELEKQPYWQRLAKPTFNASSVELDLWALTMYFVGDIAGTALMGKAFFENNPNVIQDLWDLDNGFNALLTGIPLVTRGLAFARAARTRLNSAILEWNRAMMATLDGRDPDFKYNDLSDVSETMRLRVRALQSIKSGDEFAVASNLAIYWGLMVNANKVIFWMLLNIISAPELLEKILKEIKLFAVASNVNDKQSLQLDVDGLVKSCPLFKAAFFESMRLYTAGTSYKKVLQDVTLSESAEDAAFFGKPKPQTYHITAGNYLVIPHATMQMDPRLWEDPSKFKPERFLVTDEKYPLKAHADMGHLNAFGGGSTVCKGRYFAEREILVFVAGILTVWDFSPVGTGWTMPGRFYNGTGSANPRGDVRVRMSRRA